MYNEETGSSKLAKFLMIYDYVFLDTCSLMEDSFPAFMDTLSGSREYWKEGFEVIVLGECVEELEKHSKSKDNQEARIEAKRALKILHHDKHKWHGRILTITKSKSNDGFADHAIFTAVSELRIQNKVLIITQDRTLATDLRKLNNLDSQHGRFLAVYRLAGNGDLEENPGEMPNSSIKNYVSLTKPTQTSSRPGIRMPLFHKDHRPEEKRSKIVSAPQEDANNPIIANDRKLCANLNNPNYPNDRKASDIDAQLAALNALSSEDLGKLSLAYTKDQLIQEKVKLSQTVVAPRTPHAGENERPLPPRTIPPLVVDTKTVPAPKAEPAKVEKVAPTAPMAPKPARRSWYEFGYNVQEALTKAGAHNGIIFRDPFVAYFAAVHGPYDLTSKDLDEVAKNVGVLKIGESKDLPLGPLTAHIEKTERDWKASLEVMPKEPVITTTKTLVMPAPAPEEKILVAKPEAASKEKQVSSTVVSTPETKKAAKAPSKAKTTSKTPAKVERHSKKEVTPVAPQSVTAQDDHTAVPSGVTLVVGVPTNEGTKGFIERRARREDTTEFAVAPNPNKPARKNTHAIKAAPKAETKPAPKSVKAPSKNVRAPKAMKVPSPLSPLNETIVKEDKNLNAKINNPTYPVKDKIADLEAQKARLKGANAEQEKTLFFSKAKITAKIAELKKTK